MKFRDLKVFFSTFFALLGTDLVLTVTGIREPRGYDYEFAFVIAALWVLLSAIRERQEPSDGFGQSGKA